MKLKSAFIILTMLLSLPAFTKTTKHEPKYKIRWLLAHEPVDLFREAANKFKNEVEKNSNGEAQVEIQVLSQYSTEGYEGLPPNSIVQKVQSGDIEMTQTFTTTLGNWNKDLWALDMPYLFRNHDHATNVLDGKIGQVLLDGLKPHKMKGLAFTYSGGFRVIPTNAKEIHKLEDFKGQKIRVAGSPVAISTFQTLGAIPVPGPLESSIRLAKTGEIDGAETTFPRYYSLGQDKVSRVMNETEHSLFLTSIVINDSYFVKLPKKLQAIVMSAAKSAAKDERKISVEDGAKVKEQCIKEGIKVVKMNDRELDRVKVALEPIYSKFQNYFPTPNLVTDIQNTK